MSLTLGTKNEGRRSRQDGSRHLYIVSIGMEEGGFVRGGLLYWLYCERGGREGEWRVGGCFTF